MQYQYFLLLFKHLFAYLFTQKICNEKHIINSDCVPKKVRKNPIYGYMPAILVSGDFRETYNIFACIIANPNKKPKVYNIQKDNGTALSFVSFVEQMIQYNWLQHGELLIMDNAIIHTGKEAKIIEDLLWETIINGVPFIMHFCDIPTNTFTRVEPN